MYLFFRNYLLIILLIFRFDEFGFRIENQNDFSKDCVLVDDIYEDPQYRYLCTKYIYSYYHLFFITHIK